MSKTMVPATEADTARVQRHLARMPFVGAQFAPHFRAVSAMPMPPLNERGGRDAEGWTAVYEAIVQPGALNDLGVVWGKVEDGAGGSCVLPVECGGDGVGDKQVTDL